MSRVRTLVEHLSKVSLVERNSVYLRNLVLKLAIEGKLVDQDSNEGSGAELLGRIAEIKGHTLNQESKQTTDDAITPGNGQSFFEIPTSWCWTGLESISAYIQRGKGPKYVEKSNVLVVSQKCVQWSGFDISRTRFIDPASLSKYGQERFLQPGDLLWNSTGTGTIGRVNVFPDLTDSLCKIVADSHVTVIRPVLVDPRYLWCYLASPSVQDDIDVISTGSTKQKELGTKTVREYPIPLPPLPEQKRIVAKVDELMALIDELEDKQKRRNTVRKKFQTAALDELVRAEGPEELKEAWGRVFDNWFTCTQRKPDIPALRQSIVDLASNGSFSWVQSATSDSAIEWGQMELGSLIEEIRYGTSKKCSYKTGSVPVLRIPNVTDGEIGIADIKKADFDSKEIEKWELKAGDLLVIRSNGSTSLVGRPAVVTEKASGYLYAGYLVRLRFDQNAVDSHFIKLALNSSKVRQQIELPIRTTSGVKNINSTEIKRIRLALPPLEVQKRIVAKVDELMQLCDQLEAHLIKQEELGNRLAEAVVAAA